MKERQSISKTKKGIQLLIKVIPNASKSSIVGWEGERLKLKISAPPEKGKANQELIAFFSERFHLPKSAITVSSGATGRLKTLLFSGISLEKVKGLLAGVIKSCTQ